MEMSDRRQNRQQKAESRHWADFEFYLNRWQTIFQFNLLEINKKPYCICFAIFEKYSIFILSSNYNLFNYQCSSLSFFLFREIAC